MQTAELARTTEPNELRAMGEKSLGLVVRWMQEPRTPMLKMECPTGYSLLSPVSPVAVRCALPVACGVVVVGGAGAGWCVVVGDLLLVLLV